MKVAINKKETGYSKRWVEFCKEKNIDYILVDWTSNTIIDDLENVDIFLWHVSHLDAMEKRAARAIMHALSLSGIKTFPDINALITFDDKIAQNYTLDAIKEPHATSYVFFNKDSALEWIQRATFPKVFKLSAGAGSINVKLVENADQAQRLCAQAFSKGFKSNRRVTHNLKGRYERLKNKTWKDKLSSSYKFFYSILTGRVGPGYQTTIEKNYIYFQDFIPGNAFDYRVKVIGDICWGFRRFNRPGDFRASGSGLLDFDHEKIPLELVDTAFRVAEKLNMQSVAFDFLDDQGIFKIVEYCYAFGIDEGENCGYWDRSLNRHNEEFIPEYKMIESVIKNISHPGIENAET